MTKFCPECGAPLPQPTARTREVRKAVSVVFCDVTGSTSLGERLDPESLRQVMTRYFERMQAVLESHGGTVEKFIGDAVMAVFGIPVLHEDDALRAVRAAAGMRDALAELNAELARDWGVTIGTRIGVNTGEVVAGNPSGGQNLVTGDTVNTAARLEQAAEPGEILIGEETYQLTRDAVVVEPIDPLALKGKAGAVDAYRLLEVRPGVLGHERRLDSPMVGRERPLKLLRDAFESAEGDRACYLFTVLGAAGIGKSRLAREFLDGARAGATVLSGRCLSYGEGITFWPVSEMLTAAAGIADDDQPDRARQRIRDLLRDAPDAERVSDHLASLIGLAEGVQVEAGWAVRRLFEILARSRPVVAVFDDVHWAEATMLDVIEHVADWSRDAPIFLLCMARPEFLDGRPGWGGGKARAASVQLEPLDEREADALIHNLLGNPALTPEIRQRIRFSAQGNPLFVEEMLSALLDEGILVEKDGEWVATVDLATVHVPAAISALLAARLDRLSEDERAILECAAVVGEVFDRAAVVALLADAPGDPAQADTHLGALLRKDLIRPTSSDIGGAEGFRFRHILIRDAAYEALPKQDRAELHERFSEWLASSVGERAAEYEEFIGYHFERAYRYRVELAPEDDRARILARAAFERLAAAGRRARARSDIGAAVNLLSRAAELLPAADPARLRIVADLGDVLFEAGDLSRTDQVLDEAVRTAVAAGDELAAGHARLVQLSALILSEPERGMQQAEAEANGLIPVFEAAGDELGLARAWRTLSYAAWMRMNLAEHRRVTLAAIEHARRATDLREETELVTNLLAGLIFGPVPVEALLAQTEAMEQEYAGDRKVEAAALTTKAVGQAMLGQFDEARALAARARAIKVDLGMTLWEAGSAMTDARIETRAGRLDVAERVLREGFDRLRAMDDRGFASTVASMLGLLLASQGRDQEAEQFCLASRELAAEEDVVSQSEWRTGLAPVLVRRGELDRAEALAREALARVEATDMLTAQGDAWACLADVLESRGRTDEAIEALREALSRYEQKEDVVRAAPLRERLRTTPETRTE